MIVFSSADGSSGTVITKRMKARAFTLLELLIVVIVVSILTVVALPSLEGMIWKSRFTEVFSIVGTIAKAKEAYFSEYNSYEGVPQYLYADCLAGKDIPTGSTRVQRDLGINISEGSYFQYLIYPDDEYPAENAIYFRQIPYDWAYLYDYSTKQWVAYSSTDSPAKKYFRPPS